MLRRMLFAAALSAVFVSAASAATVSYTARLSGRSEIPKTTSKGKGKFDGALDTQTKVLKYKLTFNGLSGPATAAHLHGPANRSQTAGVIAPLGDANPTSPVTGEVTLTDEQVNMLRSAKVYANIHTAANPSGEIRGQLSVVRARKRASTHTAAAAPAAAPTAASAQQSAAPK
jgi:hypothetical protein